MSKAEVVRARSEAQVARSRLIGTSHELQARLRPATIGENALDGIRRKGEAVAEQATAVVRDRPGLAAGAGAGVAAALGLGLFLRRRRRARHDSERET